MPDHIHPIHNRMLSLKKKEGRLNQKGHVFWFTGLSGSGKSTIALRIESLLFNEGRFVQLLDGDNVRTGISNNLSFSPEDRRENIRRIAEVAKLFRNAGYIVLCSFVSPLNEYRDLVKEILYPQSASIIYVEADIETCESRDVKGLYKKARTGEIKGFTGIDAPFEIPIQPELILNTQHNSLEQCVELFSKYAQPIVKL